LHASRRTSVASVLQELATSVKRRGLILVISDLLDQPKEVMRGLKQLVPEEVT